MQDKTDKEILSELRAVTKDKAHWNTAIDDVAAKLGGRYSAIVKAKALWLLGEMGLYYPLQVRPYIKQIAGYLKDDNPKLRERSVNALGRIGRADKTLILPFFDDLIKMRFDTAEGYGLRLCGLVKILQQMRRSFFAAHWICSMS